MEDLSDKVLIDILTGTINIDFDFLAFKIMLTRLRQKVKIDPRLATIQECVNELQSFFTKYGSLPRMQRDIDKISGSRRAS